VTFNSRPECIGVDQHLAIATPKGISYRLLAACRTSLGTTACENSGFFHRALSGLQLWRRFIHWGKQPGDVVEEAWDEGGSYENLLMEFHHRGRRR
jgi:hypothetical protein